MDTEKRNNAMFFLALFAMVIGEAIFFIWNGNLSTDYINGDLTLEEYNVKLSDPLKFLGIYAIFILILLLMIYYQTQIYQERYEKKKKGKDNLEGPIRKNRFDRFKYNLETNADSAIEIRTNEDMLKTIMFSELYISCLQTIETGIETLTRDQSNILKQQFNSTFEKIFEDLSNDDDMELEPGKTIKNTKKKEKKQKTQGDQDNDYNDSKKSQRNAIIALKELKNKIEEFINKDSQFDDTNEKAMLIRFKRIESEITKFLKQDYITDRIKDFNLLTSEQFNILNNLNNNDENKLHLYFRPVDSARVLDNPNIDPENVKEMKKKDRFCNLTGIYYLLSDEEKNIFSFNERRSMIERNLIIRKSYFDFHYIQDVTNTTIFCIDSKLLEEKEINTQSIQDAFIQALIDVTYLLSEEDKPLRSKIRKLEKKNQELSNEKDDAIDDLIEEKIDTNQFINLLTKKFEMRKLNATSIVFVIITSVLTGLLGYLIGAGVLQNGG
jgi:hypothetical protein